MLKVVGGTVRDCCYRNGSGGGKTRIVITGGLVDGLVVSNFNEIGWSYQRPVNIAGGVLRNFVIERTRGADYNMIVEGGVVSNGVIRNWAGGIRDRQDSVQHGGIKISGGLVTHCVLTNLGDTVTARDGTVRISGGTLRNCLVAGNKATDCAGINLSAGNLENCTVVVNDGDCPHLTGQGTYGSCLNMTGGFATNCVFYTAEAASDGRNYCRVTGGKLGNCWLSVKGADSTPAGSAILVGDNPGFKSVGGWDYIPAGSPLAGGGIFQPWMEGAIDLSGNPRVIGKRPDIGCFECLGGALMILIR